MKDNDSPGSERDISPTELKEPKSKPTPPQSHRTYLLTIISSLIVLLFIIGFLPRFFHERQLKNEASIQEVPSVRVMKATPDHQNIELILPSTSEAIRITPIWARTNGYLSGLFVDIGDKVIKGQILATIDTPEVDEELNKAEADLRSAKAKLELSRTSKARWEELFKKNPEAVSTQEVDERRSAFNAAEADMHASEANVQRLVNVQAFNKIYAPFSGTITQRDVDLGSLISAGSNGSPQELFKIAKLDIIRFFVQVPQAYHNLIKVGQMAGVTIGEFPNKVFKAKVVRTSGALDPVARTLLTELHVDNKEGTLLPGLYSQVKFVLKSDSERFIVPIQAIIIRSGAPMVALVENGDTVKLQTVKIGKDNGSTMEIISGLSEGDVIIINPTEKTITGMHVKVVSE